MRRTFPHILLLVVTGIVIYSNTLDSPFLWDDYPLIIDNINIRGLSNFTDFSGTRYLTYLSFALNYWAHGYDVTGYHIFNIAVHIINAILIYLLMLMILKTPRFKESGISQVSSLLALFSGLLFVSHPVYTMAITNINQRSVLLTTFFYLLSIVLFITAKLNYRSFLSKEHLPYYLLSAVSAVFAMKCKEISFTLPIVIFLFDRFFFKNEWGFKKSVIYLIPVLLTLFVIPLSSPQADVFNQQDSNTFRIEDESVLSGLDASNLSDIPRKDYMLTELRVILTYIRLFFFPVGLNFIYDYPIYKSFFDPNVALSFFLLLIILAFALYLFIKAKSPDSGRNLLISFGIIWFLINLLLESFVVVLNYVIFEYRLYLPSIGIILALTALTGHIIARESKIRHSLYLSALAAAVIIFSVATYSRNAVFKDEITFWSDMAKKSPLNANVHNNLGVAYSSKGHLDKAIREYIAALQIKPEFPLTLNNLARAFFKQGHTDDAIQICKVILEIMPAYENAHINLGDIYMKLGSIDDAIKHYQAAVKLRPDLAGIHFKLGLAYRQKGLIDKAQEEFQAAIKINPRFMQARQNLESLKRQKGFKD